MKAHHLFLYFLEEVFSHPQCYPQKFWKGSHFSSGDGDHGLIAVFSPGFFGVVGGGTGVRAKRWEKCLGLLTFFYYCLCAHSSPLGKEVKQERNLSARKKKTMRKREEGKKRKKSGE